MRKDEYDANGKRFCKVFHDLIRTKKLNWDEKRVLICLKDYADQNGECFPSLSTLCEITEFCRKKVVKLLRSLEAKNAIEIIHRFHEGRGDAMSNYYILHDDQIENTEHKHKKQNDANAKKYPENEKKLSKSQKSSKESKKIRKDKQDFTSEIAACQDGFVKKAPLKAKEESKPYLPGKKKNACLEYSMDDIKQMFDYDVLIQMKPYHISIVDSCMSLLFSTLNTQADRIRAGGEAMPGYVVKQRLLELDYNDIDYALSQFIKQSKRIISPNSYLLTILFSAKGQSNLDMVNKVRHDLVYL